jgi:DNA polymerase eta
LVSLSTFTYMDELTISEKASIDEAFLDLTLMVIDRLVALHPYLAAPPADAPDGLDSALPRPPPIDWTKAGNVFPINGEEAHAAVSEEAEVGEGEGHMYSSQRSDEDGNGPGGREGGSKPENGVSWEDWALCIGAEIMAEVREEVWKKLHYTCSAVSCQQHWTLQDADDRVLRIAKRWPR